MPYELDSTNGPSNGEQTAPDDRRPDQSGEQRASQSAEQRRGQSTDQRSSQADEQGSASSDSGGGSLEDSLGVSIPDEHVGAFVAEVFEDPERSTSWADVVDEMVASSAREAWDELSPREQAVEVLSKAADYDRRTVDLLEDVPLGPDVDETPEAVREALRCRRNADAFRNALADAYADGYLDDDALVGALEAAEFETELIGRREDRLEKVADVHDVDFRPYGGTLMDADDGPDPDVDHDAEGAW